MQYEAAHYLYKHAGMRRTEEERRLLYTPSEDYRPNSGKEYRQEFDIDLFFSFLERDIETVDREIFFEKMRTEYQEWL